LDVFIRQITLVAGTTIFLEQDFEVEDNAHFDGYIKFSGWHARYGRPGITENKLENDQIIFDVFQEFKNCILKLKLTQGNGNITAYIIC
jgi:hypothetical protein